MAPVQSVIQKASGSIRNLCKQGKMFLKKTVERHQREKSFKQLYEQFEAIKKSETATYIAKERLKQAEDDIREVYGEMYWRQQLEINPITREQAARIVQHLTIDEVIQGMRYEYERLFNILLYQRALALGQQWNEAAAREQSRYEPIDDNHYDIDIDQPSEPANGPSNEPEYYVPGNVPRYMHNHMRTVRALSNMDTYYVCEYEGMLDAAWGNNIRLAIEQTNIDPDDDEPLPPYSR